MPPSIISAEASRCISPSNATVGEPHTEPPLLSSRFHHTRFTLRLTPASIGVRNKCSVEVAVPPPFRPEIRVTLAEFCVAEQGVTGIQLQLRNRRGDGDNIGLTHLAQA